MDMFRQLHATFNSTTYDVCSDSCPFGMDENDNTYADMRHPTDSGVSFLVEYPTTAHPPFPRIDYFRYLGAHHNVGCVNKTPDTILLAGYNWYSEEWQDVARFNGDLCYEQLWYVTDYNINPGVSIQNYSKWRITVEACEGYGCEHWFISAFEAYQFPYAVRTNYASAQDTASVGVVLPDANENNMGAILASGLVGLLGLLFLRGTKLLVGIMFLVFMGLILLTGQTVWGTIFVFAMCLVALVSMFQTIRAHPGES